MTLTGDLVRLRLDRLAFGGEAVGRSPEGAAVFVAFGAPGDLVEVRLEEVARRYLRGRLTRVLEPGAARVEPRCPLAGRCGGCQWQHVDRPQQLAGKQAVVERSLRPLGVLPRPILSPSPAWGYRTRARFSVARQVAGLKAWRSHEVLAIATCPLLDERLDRGLARAATTLQALLPDETSLSAILGRAEYDCHAGGGRQEPALQLAVSATGHALFDAASRLVGKEGIAGVLVGDRPIGRPALDTAYPGELPFLTRADGFAQPSREGNLALRRVLAELLPERIGDVLELYAGDGNLSRTLLPRAGSLVAVESSPAAGRLVGNVPGVEVVRHDAAHAAATLASQGRRFDWVVLDPPRSGARDAAAAIARLADHVVYVSCDPMTFARDAALLVGAGFVLAEVVPLDLMPHTYHVELVARLERR